MPVYKVIGLMSGTSLDGVDIAYCIFNQSNEKWHYQIEVAETIEYSKEWINKLRKLENENAFTFVETHIEYGHYLGQLAKDFIICHNIKADFIASHGHTIFHQPEKKITSQIGDGAAIAAKTELPVVCDFRSTDVALGGQGAPLVPIGDKFLFSEFDYCLNLGGFSNISFDDFQQQRIAFDVCPCNIILNKLAIETGEPFDNKGNLARAGKCNNNLLKELNAILYYLQHPPKSLGKEWLTEYFIPIIDRYSIPIPDKLNTICEHIALQIVDATKNKQNKKILITGGGVFNNFLIERIKTYTNHEVIIPEARTIMFKEALIFAFLGVLRMTEKINCFQSVTGAEKDNIGGAVYLG